MTNQALTTTASALERPNSALREGSEQLYKQLDSLRAYANKSLTKMKDGKFVDEFVSCLSKVKSGAVQVFTKGYTGTITSPSFARVMGESVKAPLPVHAKLITLGALGVFGMVHAAKSLTTGVRSYGTYTSSTPDAAREGVVFNAAESLTSAAASVPLLWGLGSKFLGGAGATLRLVPLCFGAGLASWGLGNWKLLAKGDHPILSHKYLGSYQPLSRPEDGYISPFWHSYQAATAKLDNAVLGWSGFNRVSLTGTIYDNPLFDYKEGSIAEKLSAKENPSSE